MNEQVFRVAAYLQNQLLVHASFDRLIAHSSVPLIRVNRTNMFHSGLILCARIEISRFD